MLAAPTTVHFPMDDIEDLLGKLDKPYGILHPGEYLRFLRPPLDNCGR